MHGTPSPEEGDSALAPAACADGHMPGSSLSLLHCKVEHNNLSARSWQLLIIQNSSCDELEEDMSATVQAFCV
jgi:hypothetical protein